MEIQVNGQPHQLEEGTTLAELVSQLELEPRHIAVEVNLKLIPRAEHPDYLLADGDRLEVVTLVGGG